MQARLRSDRIHAAAVAILEKRQSLLEEAKAKEEIVYAEKIKKLLLKKTWCGGYKYNELTARDRVVPIWNGQEYFGKEWYDFYKQVRRLQSLVKISSVSGKPFPILLGEDDYALIWGGL